MRYFDLHCDTMTECFVHDKHMEENDLHVDCRRAERFETYVQCYAVWMPDQIRGPQAFQRFCQVADRFSQEIGRNQESMVQLSESDDLAAHKRKHGAILTIENAAALGGKLENIEELARRNVKLCSLTWNGENELGRGVRAPGSYGITEFGREAVRELEKHGIIVDVSHASPELFFDVAEIAKRPFVATHSNAQKICKNARNLTDEQFAVIRDRGGLVGLNLYRGFLHDNPERASLEDVFRHAEHFLSLGGADVLAFGADWDGGAKQDFVASGIETIPELYEIFLRHNYSETLLDKIFYKNAADFFKKQSLL